MPILNKQLTGSRIHFEQSLTPAEIAALADKSDLKVLQTPTPIEDKTWDMLNEKLLSKRPDVQIRVYGFYGNICDLSFLPRISNVRNFSADCLPEVKGIENLAALKNLETLSVGVFSLENFDFLGSIPGQLLNLTLGDTKSKRPRLGALSRFKELRTLFLAGQQNEIDVIGELSRLEKLTLSMIGEADLRVLHKLPHLWSLDIKLGGLSDLSALSDLNQVKYLELWQVRGLKDISFLSTMRGLQYVFLQSLPNVVALPDLSDLKALRRLYLENMKGLKQLDSIASAPILEDFIHVSARGLEPEMYDEVLQIKTLKKASVGFGSAKKNKAFLEMLAKYRIEPFKYSAFSFA